jgi:hypothetical protein
MERIRDSWDELLEGLDEDDTDVVPVTWGENFPLEIGSTFVGWWRDQQSWTGNYGETPVYLLRGRSGQDVFIWGGRAQLDNKIANASPKEGDRIAIHRDEDAPPTEPGRNGAWRVRVAVLDGDGTMPPAKDADETDEPAATGENAADEGIPF